MVNKMMYIVDRFEGNTAVCENSETGEILNIDIALLPLGTKQGDVIAEVQGNYTVCEEKTKTRRAKSKERLAALFARSKKKGE